MKFDIFRLNCDNSKDILETLDFDNYDEAEKYVKELNKVRTYNVYFQPNHDFFDGGVIYDDGYICKSKSDIDHWFANRIAKLKVKAKNAASPRKKARLERKIQKLKSRSHSVQWRQVVLIWDKFCDFWTYDVFYRIKNRFDDWISKRKRLKYFKKNHHDIRESWGLSEHMLDDLRWNLRILIDEGHGFSTQFIAEVVEEEHRDDPDFDIGDWMNHNPNPGEDTDKKAYQRMKDTYGKIIHLIDLYEFYADIQLGDKPLETKTTDMVNIVRPGTYDLLDYAEMHKKAQECWNEIWDLMKKYGQGMWD